MRLIAERLLPADHPPVYLQGELALGQQWKPLEPPKLTYHVYCSKLNPGAAELMAELCEKRNFTMKMAVHAAAADFALRSIGVQVGLLAAVALLFLRLPLSGAFDRHRPSGCGLGLGADCSGVLRALRLCLRRRCLAMELDNRSDRARPNARCPVTGEIIDSNAIKDDAWMVAHQASPNFQSWARVRDLARELRNSRRGGRGEQRSAAAGPVPEDVGA